MITRCELKNLEIDQLVALALHIEEYNIHFFRGWANRMRPYDPEVVELLTELAGDAQQYRNTLYEASRKLFKHGLPEPEHELYMTARRELDFPDDRYFVVSEKEARSILKAALALQQDTIELLTLVDNALRREFETGFLGNIEQQLSGVQSDSLDTTGQARLQSNQWLQ